ncbi:MAG TPA: hypothetical protein VJ476_06955 [Rhizomicrobium sp.]|nr:hypothetical protein [Rhizomicrobium sp.]
MMFTKKLREPVMRGGITVSVRIWQRPHVKVGGIYPLGTGHIRVTSIREIGLKGITPELARQSGFAGVVDLLKTAKHGRGEKVYLVEFVYEDGFSAPRPSFARRVRRR